MSSLTTAGVPRRTVLIGAALTAIAASKRPSAASVSPTLADIEAVVSEAKASAAFEFEKEGTEEFELAAARAEAADQRLAEASERIWAMPVRDEADIRARALLAEHWLDANGATGPCHFERSILELVRAVLARTQAPSA